MDDGVIHTPQDGNHGEIHPKKSDYVKYGIPFIMANNVKDGEIDLLNCSHITVEQAETLQKGFAKTGDVLLTHKGTVGEIAIVGENKFPFIMLTPQVTFYRILQHDKLDTYFLAASFATERFQHGLNEAAGGGTRAYIGITHQQNLTIAISESASEQRQLGSYFKSLDRMIGLHQRKYDKLVTLKQAMLQKMFPQGNATTPEIRFKGFQEDWDERKLGDVTLPISSNTLSRADLNYKSGHAKNIHYGDILVKFGEVLDADSNDIPFITNQDACDNLNGLKLKSGDVIIADAAEDSAVGKCVELFNVSDMPIVAGLHTIVIRPTIPFASYFLGYFMNSHSYHDQLLPLMQGTKVLSVSRKNLDDTTLRFPRNTDEQQKIGAYFRNLDKLIIKHALQLEKLKNIKSACLEKMFV